MSRQINDNSGHIKFAASQSIVQTSTEWMGLSEIEWASAFLPVLAIEEGIDLTGEFLVGMRARTAKRSDLAARLGVDWKRPIGAQLVSKAVLSYDEGRLVDGDMFRDRLFHLHLRIDDSTEDVLPLLDRYNLDGLIEEIVSEAKHDGYLFVELTTRDFLDLAQKLSKDIPGLAVLLSMNDSVLYI